MPRMRLFAIVLLAAACGGKKPAAPPAGHHDAALAPPAPDAAIDAAARVVDAAAALAGLATEGPACLVVRTPDGTVSQSDPDLCAERLRPMSTFKVPNALIGADVGLLDGPDAIMPYDARFPAAAGSNPEWSKDQSLRKALEISAVPLFRRLASDIGAERMQAHLDAFHYGNHSQAGGLTQFWLSGGLAISAVEQVEFLGQVTAGTLPVSDRALATVRAALPAETQGVATLHHKTGTGPLDGGPWIGWLVGWVDRPEGAYPFACWIKHAPADVETIRAYRLRVCRGALERAGVFPASP